MINILPSFFTMTNDKLPKDVQNLLDKELGLPIYETKIMVQAMSNIPLFIESRYKYLEETRKIVIKVYRATYEELNKAGLDNHTAEESSKAAALNELNKRKIIQDRMFPDKVYKYAIQKSSETALMKINIAKIDPSYNAE